MGHGLAEQPGFPALPAAALRGICGPLRRDLADSDHFYSYTLRDFRLEDRLTFSSPARSRYPENNTVHAGLFPAPNDAGGQWSCCPNGMPDRMATWVWLSCSTGWHYRATDEPGLSRRTHARGAEARRLPRVEQHRTDDSCGTAIGCGYARLPGLAGSQGYSLLGVLGTSLGSCVAFIAAAHDGRSAWGSSIMCPCISRTWCGRGSPAKRKQGLRGQSARTICGVTGA